MAHETIMINDVVFKLGRKYFSRYEYDFGKERKDRILLTESLYSEIHDIFHDEDLLDGEIWSACARIWSREWALV
ncbi:hypothetical protein [Selenomonas sp. AB3002]|uniref:hypothetical protein n=1 Tax=Selenomonas sp. AB3002 TaxID=1392502 RepID=UPI00049518AB